MRRVALIPGDGVGPEISAAARLVLDATGVAIDWQMVEAGQAAVAHHGEPLPDVTVETIKHLGVVLKGPLIAPKGTGRIHKQRDGQEVIYPSVNNALRRELGLFVNVRPLKSYPGLSRRVESLDIVIMREVSEGIYSGVEYRVGDDTAEAVKRVTRRATERVARYSFDYARQHSRRLVTLGHKANVLNLTDGLMLKVTGEVALEYPDIVFDDMMIDALGMTLVRDPSVLDVLILDNQYGDILSDVGAGLVGSLGLAPGANYGERVAMFEAAHGAAPDIAGQGVVNPVAFILSAALMLHHLGEAAAATRIEWAVAEVLGEGEGLTRDVGGTASTQQLAERIAARVAQGMTATSGG